MPARDRYDGPLWRTLRHVDRDGSKAKVAFLSARYGFRTADTPIELYDPAYHRPRRPHDCRRGDDPLAAPSVAAQGYVTIYEGGHIVWQGAEEAMPARFRHTSSNCSGPAPTDLTL